MKRCSVCVAALVGSLACVQRVSAWAITDVGAYTYSGVEGLSGITWAGGNQFYMANDGDNGVGALQPATIGINLSSGAVTSLVFGAAVSISGDLEGVAYNPSRKSVFISNETGPAIKEYYPNGNGLVIGSVTLPSIFSQIRSNKSLESVTVSGDGLTLWTANEEALTCDGDISSTSSGTTVRLTRFTRPDLNTATWTCVGQWAYKTDKFSGDSGLTDKLCHGVSDLCALPDGTLLILERDCSEINVDFIVAFITANLDDSTLIHEAIYAVAPAEFTAAKNILAVSALSTASYTTVNKTSLWASNTGVDNYEGMCIGPRLSNGDTSLLLVSDGDTSTITKAGRTYTINWGKKVRALKLTGGSIVSLDSNASAYGTVYPPAGPYRYMSGTNVTVSVTVPDATFSNYYYCTGCTLSGGMSKICTNGSPASTETFAITGDHTVCSWNWGVMTADGFPLTDSFEAYAIGRVLDNVGGWTGSGIVSAETYTAATPPGFPITNAVHTKVLVSEDTAERAVNTTAGENVIVDFMTKPRRAAELLADFGTGVHCAIAEDTNGFLCIWHQMSTGATRWTRLQKHAIADGVWVRMSFTLDFNSGAYLMVQPRVNGSLCPTAYGFRGPEDLRSPGSWYICADQGSGNKKLSAVSMVGQGSMDDLVVADSALSFAHTGSTSTNNIPFVWFDSNGIARDPLDDLDGDGRTAAQEYIAGTDPNDATSFFQILRTWKEDGLAVVQFTGSNPLATYAMKVCTNLLLKDGWTTVTGDLSLVNGTNTWKERAAETNSPAIFFRPVAAISGVPAE